jgi:hypothetical protein
MRKASLLATAAIVISLIPSPAFAWGTAAHKYIMGRALDLLPAELKPFFDANRPEIVARSVDPDLWRVVGWPEDPNHFVDFGMKELGEFPFTALPREYGAALEKFGPAMLDKIGRLPWREAEEFGNLRRGFEAFARESGFGGTNVVLFSGIVAHYIQDAHQPFHGSVNYDGQLTGNTGIHARFEAELFERFQSRLTINPAPPAPIHNVRDFAFDVLLASYQQVDAILKADTEAIGAKEVYDDAYYEAFFAKVRPVLEQRIAQSITATAGVIIGAWEAAGKPVVRLVTARTVQRVKKP